MRYITMGTIAFLHRRAMSWSIQTYKRKIERMHPGTAQLSHNLLHHTVVPLLTKYPLQACDRSSRQRSRPKHRIQSETHCPKHNQGYDRVRQEICKSSQRHRIHTRASKTQMEAFNLHTSPPERFTTSNSSPCIMFSATTSSRQGPTKRNFVLKFDPMAQV